MNNCIVLVDLFLKTNTINFLQVKPPSSDGKHQVTTETEIMTTEILKHRQLGNFLERTEYLLRKVVIPLEVPKTVRGRFDICILFFFVAPYTILHKFEFISLLMNTIFFF